MNEAGTVRIVMAEDSAADAELARYAIRRGRIAAEIVLATTEAEFRAALLSLRPHIIISDNSMPQFSGKEALAIARELTPDTPFVFLSGTLVPGRDAEATLSQADARLDKKDLDGLSAIVRGLLDSRAGPRES